MSGETSTGSKPTVLVVDDEPELADLFATWLRDAWTPRTAYDGDDGLEQIDEDVAVVLLDRRMPGLSGDAVLEEIRNRGYDCRVIMVTAVDPDFDIIAMGFDDYLVKPVSKEELLETVDAVYRRTEYSQTMLEYYSLVSKRAVLETEKSRAELEENDEFKKLEARIDDLAEKVDEAIENMQGHEDFAVAFHDLPDDNS